MADSKVNTNDEFFGDMYDSYGGPLGLWLLKHGVLVEVTSEMEETETYEELLRQELNDAKGG